MALYGNLRDYKFGDAADDIRGTDVHGANDEKLGTIDDVIFDSNSGEMKYVVVDTGGWLSSSKFIVPARQIREMEGESDRYHVSLNKEQIERFPQYDEKALESENDFGDYEKRYEQSWSDGPILHQEGSTRILTPEASEMPPAVGGTASFGESGRSMKPIARDLPRFGATSDSESASRTGGLVDSRDLEPVRPGQEVRGTAFGNESTLDAEADMALDADRDEDIALEAELDDEPVELSRDEFLKEGTLRSEYDAPSERADMRDRPVTQRRRWEDFQDRLRTEREQIIARPRRDRDKAA